MEGGAAVAVEVNCTDGAGGGGGAYTAVLRRRLDLYCAAVDKSMEANSQESSLGYFEAKPQASDNSQLVSQASINGYGVNGVRNSNAIYDDDQGKPANTSKKEAHNYGYLEENTDPATNAKRLRIIRANWESARRSRKRKQGRLSYLESQVSQLRSENASLQKRLADKTQEYTKSTIEINNLRVDVDTMRRKDILDDLLSLGQAATHSS